MFGRDLSWGFQDDPFFRSHNDMMQRMMGNFQDPFDTNTRQRNMPRGPQRIGAPMELVAPMDMFQMNNSMFNNSVFENMHHQMSSLENDPNSHSYSSSTVMSYSSNGNGPPQYYHATKSTKRAPGGIKETQKSVRDSQAGVHKMAIEQHLGNRGHRYERTKNLQQGNIEEEREFYNMDEEDATHFDREWQQQTRSAHHAIGHNRRHKSYPRLMHHERNKSKH